jgi:hypothetical protein
VVLARSSKGAVAVLDRFAVIVAALVVAMAATPAVRAATWQTEPFLRLGGGADDNVDLSVDSIGTVYSGNAAAGVTLSRVTETVDVNAAATVGYTDYFGNDEAPEDRDFQLLQLGSGYRQERSLWRFDGSYLRDATFVDVQQPLDVGTDPGSNIDEGLTETNVRRQRLLLSPSFEHSFTQRLSGNLEYSGTSLNYDKKEGVNLQDTWTHDLLAGMSYQFSNRDRYGLAAGSTIFRSDDTTEDLDIYSLSLTGERRLTELSRLTFSAGARRTEPQGDTAGRKSDTGFLGSFLARTRGENWNGALSLERKLRPSGDGTLKETDQILLRASRDLSPRLAASIVGRAYETRVPGDSEAGEEQYADVAPTLSWRLTNAWSLRGTYRYRWIDRALEQESADSNAVFLTLQYAPPSEVPGI